NASSWQGEKTQIHQQMKKYSSCCPPREFEHPDLRRRYFPMWGKLCPHMGVLKYVHQPRPMYAIIESFAGFLTIKDQLEVCPVSGRGTFNLLSIPLQDDIRFLQPPLPAHSTACLATHLPRRREYGLTEFRTNDTHHLGSAYTPKV